MENDQSGIYAIHHVRSGNRYVGSSVAIRNRWRQHVYILRRNKHHSPRLQNAWNKYGESEFRFVVLEVVDDLAQLIDREQHYIDTGDHSYNHAPVAGSRRGVPHGPEAQAKMVAAQKAAWASPEGRANHMAALANVDQARVQAKRRVTLGERYPEGVKMPAWFSEMLAERNRARNGIPTGRVFPDDVRAKIAASNARLYASGARRIDGVHHPMFGKTHADESKAKMSAAKLGKPSVKRLDPTMCAKLLHLWIPGQKECRRCAAIAASSSRLRRLGRTEFITPAERMTPEVAAKISATMKARGIAPPAGVQGNRRGQTMTQEHRDKIAAAMRGNTLSPDAVAKISATKRGKPSSKRADPSLCAKGFHAWVAGQKECGECGHEKQLSNLSPPR